MFEGRWLVRAWLSFADVENPVMEVARRFHILQTLEAVFFSMQAPCTLVWIVSKHDQPK